MHVVTAAAGHSSVIAIIQATKHNCQLVYAWSCSRAQLGHLEVHVPELSHVATHHLVTVAEDNLA